MDEHKARRVIEKYDPHHYHTYEELTELLHAFAAAYGSLCRVLSIGRSPGGRDIWAVELGAPPRDDKPGYYIDGNLHASEVAGCAAAVYTIHHLLTGYGEDERATRLLDEVSFYIVPRISVDGAEACLVDGVGPYNLRSAPRLWPEPEPMPGLHPCDVNGDGRTLLMRWEAPDGEWAVSDDDPRLMVPREPHERDGTFYKLTWEGTIEDFDGATVTLAPNRWGLDFNRNWPARWEPHPEQRGAGPYPLSEPETRAVADYILSRPNIGGMQSYHTTSGVILRPLTHGPDDDMHPMDLAAYEAIGAAGERLTGYPCVSIYHDFTKGRPIRGGFVDWTYEHLGASVFSTELWDALARAGAPRVTLHADWADAGLKLLRWNDEELGGEGFIDWTPFHHPQLGPVEIGGWDTMFVLKNPPKRLLAEESKKNMLFTLAHAESLPRLAITDTAAERLGGGLYRLSAVVRNMGYLPTYVTEQAKKAHRARPVTVSLQLPAGFRLLQGPDGETIGHLGGRIHGDHYIFSAPAPFQKERKLRWIVAAASEAVGGAGQAGPGQAMDSGPGQAGGEPGPVRAGGDSAPVQAAVTASSPRAGTAMASFPPFGVGKQVQ